MSLKKPRKKKAASARTQKKPTRKVGLAPGGSVPSKSRVNEAGNYTKPAMRKRQFSALKLAAKAVSPDNGRRVKRRCWRLPIKMQGADTN